MDNDLLIQNNTEDALVEDCVVIWTENDFLSRWHRIKAYHEIGTRILEEGTPYGSKIVSLVAQSIGKSTRNIYRAIEFAKMFPDLDLLPEGKNTTWYMVINKYLSSTIEEEIKPELVYVCPTCNSEYKKSDIKFIRKNV